MYVEIALFFLVLLVYAIIRDRKPANMPPGPTGIPFFGSMPFFDEHTATKLRNKYGDMVTYRTGNFRSVFLFDYHTAKEVLARAEFAARPEFFKEASLDERKQGGLVSSVGVQWVHDRRFALRNLRNLGMGKSYLEEAINIEAQALVDDLKKYQGEPIKFPDSLKTAALNIIWQMVASKRYDLRSKEVEEMYTVMKELQKSSAIVFLPMFIPMLKYLPKLVLRYMFSSHKLDSFVQKMRESLLVFIDTHEKEELADQNDVINQYLKEMKEEEESDDPIKFFRKGALLQIIHELFLAGSETVSHSLKWACFLMARYPDISKKIQQQIDGVVGRDRLVSLSDKADLPLVDAFALELLRYSSLIAQNIQRIATQDTTINGYFIPKGTVVIASNYHINMDARFWKDPEKFDPERHIDEDGRCKQPKEGFFPFDSGRRQCLGESLARMELFLFSAAILQHFNVEVPPGVTLTDEFEIKLRFRCPKDTTLIYRARS